MWLSAIIAGSLVTPEKIRERIKWAIRILRDGRIEQKLALILAIALAGLSYLALGQGIPSFLQDLVPLLFWLSTQFLHNRGQGTE